MIQSANFPIFFVLCKKIIKKNYFFCFLLFTIKIFFIPLHVRIDSLDKNNFIYEEKDSNT